jgi:hypothetical protein
MKKVFKGNPKDVAEEIRAWLEENNEMSFLEVIVEVL